MRFGSTAPFSVSLSCSELRSDLTPRWTPFAGTARYRDHARCKCGIHPAVAARIDVVRLGMTSRALALHAGHFPGDDLAG